MDCRTACLTIHQQKDIWADFSMVTEGKRPREEGNPAGKEKRESRHARKQTLPFLSLRPAVLGRELERL